MIEAPTRPPLQLRAPSVRLMLSHPAHFVSFGFGSGLAPFAPGTFGSIVGWILARWLQPALGDAIFFSALLAFFLVSVWAAHETTEALGAADHGAIVSDELVAMALIVAMLPGAFWQQLSAFVLFRLLDIRKPGPVGWADRNVDGAFGIMLDDIIAAALTLFLLALWFKLF